MAQTGGKRFSNGEMALAAGAGAALLLAAAGYLVFQATRTAPPSAPVAEVAQPVEPVAESTEPANAPDEKPAPDSESAPEPVVPGFDVVRIEADGTAVIAGQAEPGARVTIVMDGETVGEAQADANGDFVAFTMLGNSDTARVLSLRAEGAGGAQVSAESAIVEPAPVQVAQAQAGVDEVTAPAATPVEAAPVAPASSGAAPQAQSQTAETDGPAGESTQAPAPVATAPSAPVEATQAPAETVITEAPAGPDVAAPSPSTAPESLQAEATPPQAAPAPAPTAEEPEPTAPRVLLADSSGITVMQQGGIAPAAQQTVSIDSISYDAVGDVELAGRGRGAADVRVYLDNRPILTGRIAEDGQWRLPLPDVESGVYTLRVDEIAADGSVTSRVETPFKREEPAQLVAAAEAARAAQTVQTAPDGSPAPTAGAAPSVQAITVQPGFTLWAIARERYGAGILYVRVFEANRDQIRDPDLIYPGQVFALPGQ